MSDLDELERDMEIIKERNLRVESDKAWETSYSRKILLALLTYFVVVLFFIISNISRPFLNAIVPTIGFVLSTLTIPAFKGFWIKNIYKNRK